MYVPLLALIDSPNLDPGGKYFSTVDDRLSIFCLILIILSTVSGATFCNLVSSGLSSTCVGSCFILLALVPETLLFIS